LRRCQRLGEVEALLADTGYFSEGNVNACTAAGIEPLIAQGRQDHYPKLEERTAADPPEPKDLDGGRGDKASSADQG
jgi:hypothetical protein